MRLVIAAAALMMVASSGAVVAPPPPPAPVGADVPAQTGGYSTDWMNGAYRYWLRNTANAHGLTALERAAPKTAEQSQGASAFALREGPRVTFEVSLGDGVERYAFHHVCPRAADMPSPAMAEFQEYVTSVRDRCAWQVSRVRVRFRAAEETIGEAHLRPDFARLAALLRQAGVKRDQGTPIPDHVFRALRDPEPLFARATSLASIGAARCPAIAAVLAELDQRQVRLDLAGIATDRASVTPPIEASSFRLELPLVQGGNGFGALTMTDQGAGLASDAWRMMSERIEPCLRRADSAADTPN